MSLRARDLVRINFNIPLRSFRLIKAECALNGITMTMFIRGAIRDKFDAKRRQQLKKLVVDGDE